MQTRNTPLAVNSPCARISRSLTAAVGIVVAGVLLVGGTSIILALQIFQSNKAVARDYDRLLMLDELHSTFDNLVFELLEIESVVPSDHATEALLMQEAIVRQLAAFGETDQEGSVGAVEGREKAILGNLRTLCEQARVIVERRRTRPGHLPKSDHEWLHHATQIVPLLVADLAELHGSRIARLQESNRRRVYGIVALYAAFLVVGGTLVPMAGAAARRAITTPLRKIADAASEIAKGHFDARIPVRTSNEVGQLSSAFNAMADRLQAHEDELRAIHSELEDKVKESQALYRIGTEISRPHELDRILQSVVDNARDLLRSDAAALCLFAPGKRIPIVQATSGPPEAFHAGSDASDLSPLGKQESRAPWPSTLVIKPEYARGHLAAPLRLGDDSIGVILVSCREERKFTEAEAELLAALATQAAIAVERARLSEELRNLAAGEERERIAREMHDDLAQSLGLLHLKLQSALAHVGDTRGVARALREMVHIVDHAYEDVRQSIFGLRALVSGGPGLVPTLAAYLNEFGAQNGIAVELEVAEGKMAHLPPASEFQAVRIIQEALTNVRKHAQAERARVSLQQDGPWVRVAVEDDGVGWDPVAVPDRLHFGLQTMRERAESLGGQLEIEAKPGRGTVIRATLPGVGA